MIAPFCRTTRYFLVIAVYGLTACAPAAVKKHPAFDFSQIKQIKLQIAGSDAGLADSLAQKVSANLNDRHYPVVAMEDGKTISHRMKAIIGQPEHAKTPTGVSFSMGSSDPRALDFQKTDVLPVSCELTSTTDSAQTWEFKMGFSGDVADKKVAAVDKLADHISTVCFNLLHEVKWPLPVLATKPEVQKSSWMPQIQVETKEVPNVSVKKVESSNAEEPQAPASVTLESRTEAVNSPSNSDEPRKQIIIHNQGSPIIIEMGHQRR